MHCQIAPFVPGRRPTDEDTRPGLGSSDSVALVTGDDRDNEAVVLFEVSDMPARARMEATVAIDDAPLPGWDGHAIRLTEQPRQRLRLRPEHDMAGVELGFSAAFLRKARVELRVVRNGSTLATDTASLDVCDIRNLGTLYQRLLDKLVAPDTARQASEARMPNPGVAYHPWYPVLKIGSDKAALYTAALVADIVDKEYHLTDPAWLLRVGVYLELLTCIGIFEAVRNDVGDLLDADERAALDESEVFAEIRERIDVRAWKRVWGLRRITFPSFGTPRTGPVSVLNLLRKREATLHFLHVHHEDLKHAIELAGANRFNSQETWQRVFRDAERAVMRQSADAFPELSYLPPPARDVVLWQRLGFAGQQGVYPTACNEYRASMNSVAEWAKTRGLMDHAGRECVPREASLLEAYTHDRSRVAVLQRQDGLGPSLKVLEPVVAHEPTIAEIEQLIAEVAIFRMLSKDEVHTLAAGTRPLLLGPTQRFVVEGAKGTSLFLVGDGQVEVRARNADGTDWLVDRLGRGEVVGEMALLTGEPRNATVRSVEESVVYEIGREQYQPLVLAHPEWLDELAAVMNKRLSRRGAIKAQRSAEARPQPLLERIRRNFFG